MAAKYVAAVDHGTTSTRCILFDGDGAPTATTQRGQTMHYPRPGWLELAPGAGLLLGPGAHHQVLAIGAHRMQLQVDAVGARL
jgi:glycerol kinase